MKKIWRKWKKIVDKIISVEASIVFGLIYIVIIIPLAFILKIISPTIFFGSSYKPNTNSYWNKVPKKNYDLTFARKQ